MQLVGSSCTFVRAHPPLKQFQGFGLANPGIAVSPTRGETAGIDLLRKSQAVEISRDIAASAISPLVGEIAILLRQYRDDSSR